jgi:hypothetical protein
VIRRHVIRRHVIRRHVIRRHVIRCHVIRRHVIRGTVRHLEYLVQEGHVRRRQVPRRDAHVPAPPCHVTSLARNARRLQHASSTASRPWHATHVADSERRARVTRQLNSRSCPCASSYSPQTAVRPPPPSSAKSTSLPLAAPVLLQRRERQRPEQLLCSPPHPAHRTSDCGTAGRRDPGSRAERPCQLRPVEAGKAGARSSRGQGLVQRSRLY